MAEKESNKDKIILITGATSGIGKVTAFELAKKNAKLILLVRNNEKGKALIDDIKDRTGNSTLDLFTVDLSLQEDIRKVAAEIKEKYNKINILINNAGLIINDKIKTAEGIEYTFALNHLGYFLLTGLLLDLLKAGAPSRIINVSSRASSFGKIDFNDLMGDKKYNSMTAYCQSKLANILFTYELDRWLNNSGITVNCLHPGTVRTNFGKDLKGTFHFFMNIARPFMSSPEKGAETTIYLADSPHVEGISGKYFVKKKPVKSPPDSYNEVLAKKLWKVSEELTGFVYPKDL